MSVKLILQVSKILMSKWRDILGVQPYILDGAFKKILPFLLHYYTNIKWYINQCEFGSFNFNLSCANKCRV